MFEEAKRTYEIIKKVFNDIYENLGGNVRIIVSAAAPIDPKVGKWLQNIGICFLQGYGLTETSPIVALNPLEHFLYNKNFVEVYL